MEKRNTLKATKKKSRQVYRYLIWMNGMEYDALADDHMMVRDPDSSKGILTLHLYLNENLIGYFKNFDCFVRNPIGLKDNLAPQSE